MDSSKEKEAGRYTFDKALDTTGFGKYNIGMLASCCLLILAMYVDIFGFSVILPSVTCDMNLTTAQQGLLSAIPLVGVMTSSYAWGLFADTRGRRKTLLIAMPMATVFNFLASFAPNYASLAILKFFSAGFASSANAAAFVLLGESVPMRLRSRFMFLMASATMVGQLVICVVALPVYKFTFSIYISWLSMYYRPWRLLLQLISIPGILGVIGMLLLHESPKFLLSNGKEAGALDSLRHIYRANTGNDMKTFSVTSVYLEENVMKVDPRTSFIRRMWNQTAPLFKPPLLRNSVIVYYILLCAYMTSTGYTMWVPTMTNAYFSSNETRGKTFCEVASSAASSSSSTSSDIDCNNVIQPMTLYAVMCYSGLSGLLNLLLTFVVGPLGKRRTTLLVFSLAICCGLALLFVRIPVLSIILFYNFLYVALILGNANTYLVELNPTYLRGMATCLSVVVARGSGFFSVQLIANLLADHCTPMITSYIILVASGLAVATLLPPDKKRSENKNTQIVKNKTSQIERF